MSTVAEHFDLCPPAVIGGNRGFFCGVEYEIEDIHSKGDAPARFHIEIDHSLRNNGLEFKARPRTFDLALNDFTFLHDTIKTGPNPFSERTSIHVHVNVSNLSLKETRELVLTYALLEPLFFKYVGETRQNSIFCVPLYYTTLPQLYNRDITKLHGSWHKYTAFNILPMGSNGHTAALGTVEFRHLYGTGDFSVFSKWLTILKELYTFIESHANYNTVQSLQSGATPFQIATRVSPTLIEGLSEEEVNVLCKDTVLDVKLASGGLVK